MDLKFTAGNCACVQTPWLTLHVRPHASHRLQVRHVATSLSLNSPWPHPCRSDAACLCQAVPRLFQNAHTRIFEPRLPRPQRDVLTTRRCWPCFSSLNRRASGQAFPSNSTLASFATCLLCHHLSPFHCPLKGLWPYDPSVGLQSLPCNWCVVSNLHLISKTLLARHKDFWPQWFKNHATRPNSQLRCIYFKR